jgi:hypothetical protein
MVTLRNSGIESVCVGYIERTSVGNTELPKSLLFKIFLHYTNTFFSSPWQVVDAV